MHTTAGDVALADHVATADAPARLYASTCYPAVPVPRATGLRRDPEVGGWSSV
jgi:hypothetical protein